MKNRENNKSNLDNPERSFIPTWKEMTLVLKAPQ